MELREFLQLIRRQWLIVAAVPLVALIVSLVFVKRQPITFETAATLTISRGSSLDQAQVPFYLYDNFYSIQAAGFVADTATAWLNSPSVVKDIYDRAQIDPGKLSSTKQLQKVFKSRKIVPANVEFSTVQSEASSGEKLVTAATEAVKARVDEVSKGSVKTGGIYQVFAEQPITVQTDKPYLIVALASLILGTIIGSFGALIKEYLK
ncbi:hypothetical protein HYZ64_03230 [Candidatus Berkelbacteria bacterium]|nr:hypothetical protein [Candidatus Berkelbacteria bacterium]